MASNNLLKKYYKRSKLWQTHDPRMVVVFLIVLIIASSFITAAIFYIRSSAYTPSNNYISYIASLYGSTSGFLTSAVQKSEIEQFNVSTSYMNETIPVEINFTLSSDSYFAQNTLFKTDVTATVNEYPKSTNTTSINDISVQFQGAIDATPNSGSLTGFTSYSYGLSYPSTVYLGNWYLDKHWQGSNYVTFPNNGSIVCNVSFGMSPNYSDSAAYQTLTSYLNTENKTFQSTANFTYTLSNVQVRSYLELSDSERSSLQSMTSERQQTLQTELSALLADLAQNSQNQANASENMNIGLTCVIAFLALVEVSFIIYEHSKDEERAEKYSYEKSREKQGDISYCV